VDRQVNINPINIAYNSPLVMRGNSTCNWLVEVLLPPTKEEVNTFARVCLSVCLLARLLKTRAWIWMKCCVWTDVGTWTN